MVGWKERKRGIVPTMISVPMRDLDVEVVLLDRQVFERLWVAPSQKYHPFQMPGNATLGELLFQQMFIGHLLCAKHYPG